MAINYRKIGTSGTAFQVKSALKFVDFLLQLGLLIKAANRVNMPSMTVTVGQQKPYFIRHLQPKAHKIFGDL